MKPWMRDLLLIAVNVVLYGLYFWATFRAPSGGW